MTYLKKITIPLVLICLLPAGRIGAQGIDLDKIKATTQDPASPYFYNSLVKEFLGRPSDFDVRKAISIYYGKLFSKYYTPYSISPDQGNFDEMLRRENYQRAISLGERMLENDPVNFSLLLQVLRCYIEAKEDVLADLTRKKVDVLEKAILHSGDGQEAESAYRIIDIADEYSMMAIMGVKGLSRRSERKSSSVIDAWKIKPAKKGEQKSLYFELLLNRKPSID